MPKAGGSEQMNQPKVCKTPTEAGHRIEGCEPGPCRQRHQQRAVTIRWEARKPSSCSWPHPLRFRPTDAGLGSPILSWTGTRSGQHDGAPSPEQQAGATGSGRHLRWRLALGCYTALAPGRTTPATRRPADRAERSVRLPAAPLQKLPLRRTALPGKLASCYDTLLAGHGVAAWLRDRMSAIELTPPPLRTEAGPGAGVLRKLVTHRSRPTSFACLGGETTPVGLSHPADVEHLQGLDEELRGRQRPLQRLAVVWRWAQRR